MPLFWSLVIRLIDDILIMIEMLNSNQLVKQLWSLNRNYKVMFVLRLTCFLGLSIQAIILLLSYDLIETFISQSYEIKDIKWASHKLSIYIIWLQGIDKFWYGQQLVGTLHQYEDKLRIWIKVLQWRVPFFSTELHVLPQKK